MVGLPEKEDNVKTSFSYLLLLVTVMLLKLNSIGIKSIFCVCVHFVLFSFGHKSHGTVLLQNSCWLWCWCAALYGKCDIGGPW